MKLNEVKRIVREEVQRLTETGYGGNMSKNKTIKFTVTYKVDESDAESLAEYLDDFHANASSTLTGFSSAGYEAEDEDGGSWPDTSHDT